MLGDGMLDRIAKALELISIQLTLANAVHVMNGKPGALSPNLSRELRSKVAECARALLDTCGDRQKTEAGDENSAE